MASINSMNSINGFNNMNSMNIMKIMNNDNAINIIANVNNDNNDNDNVMIHIKDNDIIENNTTDDDDDYDDDETNRIIYESIYRKQTLMNSNKTFINRCIVFSIIVILFMYLPLLLGYQCYSCAGITDDQSNNDMYNSVMLKMALLSSFITCIPMVLYSLSNIYDRYRIWKRIHKDNRNNNISMNETLTSTLMMMFLLNIPDLYLLLIGIPLRQDDFIYASLQVRDTFFNLFFVVNSMSLAPTVFTKRVFFTSFMPFAISNAIYNFSLIGQYYELSMFAVVLTVGGLFDILFNTITWFIHMKKVYGFSHIINNMNNDESKCSMNTLLFVIYNYAGWLSYWTCPFPLFLVIYTYIVIFISIMHIFVLHRVSISLSMQLRAEKDVTEYLITRTVPRDSAEEFLKTGKMLPRVHRNVTIFFSDIEDFTNISSKVSPIQIMNLLSRLYSNMDGVAKKFSSLFKVETIGDAYVIVGGLNDNDINNTQSAVDVANFALLVRDEVKNINSPLGSDPIRIRIGLHRYHNITIITYYHHINISL